MNKREFESFIKHVLKDLPLEKQEKLLEKMRFSWLPDIHEKFEAKAQKKHTKCSKCKKYFLTKNFSTEHKIEKRYGVLVYSDSGYGDDDELADVTYEVIYSVCPGCGHKTEIKKFAMYEENRHTRR